MTYGPLRTYGTQDLPFVIPHLVAELLQYGTVLPPAQTIVVRDEPSQQSATQQDAAQQVGGMLPLRCKTGTSNGFRDAWTAGIVGPYVLVVWVGNFDNILNKLLIDGTVADPLFEDLARQLQSFAPLDDPIAAQSRHLGVSRIAVCSDTGDTDTSLCPTSTEMWYIPGRSPTAPSGIYRRILVDAVTGLRLCAPKNSRLPAHKPIDQPETAQTASQKLCRRAQRRGGGPCQRSHCRQFSSFC